MTRLFALLFFFISAAQADEKELRIQLGWKYVNLPAGLMKTHELGANASPKLWETGTATALSATPAGSEIPEGKLLLYPGSNKTFVLVIRNTTKQPLYFFAAPHQVSPAAASLGFKFKCLCVNHAFKVAPGAIWYRVVQLQLAEKYRGEGTLEIVHDLIGIDARQMQDFALPKAGHQHED